MNPTSTAPRAREVPRGAEVDATPDAAWESIAATANEVGALIRRSRSEITAQEVFASIGRCNKLLAHAEWAISRSLAEAP